MRANTACAELQRLAPGAGGKLYCRPFVGFVRSKAMEFLLSALSSS